MSKRLLSAPHIIIGKVYQKRRHRENDRPAISLNIIQYYRNKDLSALPIISCVL